MKILFTITLITVTYLNIWHYKANLRIENELNSINSQLDVLTTEKHIFDKVELDLLEL